MAARYTYQAFSIKHKPRPAPNLAGGEQHPSPSAVAFDTLTFLHLDRCLDVSLNVPFQSRPVVNSSCPGYQAAQVSPSYMTLLYDVEDRTSACARNGGLKRARALSSAAISPPGTYVLAVSVSVLLTMSTDRQVPTNPWLRFHLSGATRQQDPGALLRATEGHVGPSPTPSPSRSIGLAISSSGGELAKSPLHPSWSLQAPKPLQGPLKLHPSQPSVPKTHAVRHLQAIDTAGRGTAQRCSVSHLASFRHRQRPFTAHICFSERGDRKPGTCSALWLWTPDAEQHNENEGYRHLSRLGTRRSNAPTALVADYYSTRSSSSHSTHSPGRLVDGDIGATASVRWHRFLRFLHVDADADVKITGARSRLRHVPISVLASHSGEAWT
ncbi:hypothetical protein G7046_g1618 [Stylonectria norvegica]|nr:hypothetical protein G7046_g1618 [Stylonectria norvegica]